MTDSTKVNTTVTELYGSSDPSYTTIRLSNGGAGATGVLRALAEDYLRMDDVKNVNVGWLRNLSRNGLEALATGHADIALTYERDQEHDFIAKHEGKDVGCIFNGHWAIVGPKGSKVTQGKGEEAAKTALKEISEDNSINFLSRDDGSATHCKELELWQLAGVIPDSHPMFKEARYKRHQVFPQETLRLADELNAFLIVEWGSWLSFRNSLKNTQIYVVGGKTLLNPCHCMVVAKNASVSHIKHFLDYLTSARAQTLLKHYGEEKIGEPLFTPAVQIDFDAWA